MAQLNDWLSIDKISGTGDATITLTASSYQELVDRTASIKIQAQSTNAILNVKQKAYSPTEKNNNYFWVEFEKSGGTVTFPHNTITAQPYFQMEMQYSFDGENWFDAEGYTIELNENKIIYLYNKTRTLGGANGRGRHIKFSQNCSIGGDITSLSDIIDGAFFNTFKDNAYLKDASNLILPVSVTYKMYTFTFQNCINLIKAPKLPATTLAERCYNAMFTDCTSLTTAPELPATTLVEYCYESMFYGCTSLNYIKMMATDISASGCFGNWVNGVSSTGTFIKHPDANLPTGTSGIPSGWTVETATE